MFFLKLFRLPRWTAGISRIQVHGHMDPYGIEWFVIAYIMWLLFSKVDWERKENRQINIRNLIKLQYYCQQCNESSDRFKTHQ